MRTIETIVKPSTDSTALASPIAQRVMRLLSEDDAGGLVRQADRAAPWSAPLTMLELDLRDWGIVYGMCFALARNEDAWEPQRDCAERAFLIANEVYQRWGGKIAERGEPREGDEEGNEAE